MDRMGSAHDATTSPRLNWVPLPYPVLPPLALSRAVPGVSTRETAAGSGAAGSRSPSCSAAYCKPLLTLPCISLSSFFLRAFVNIVLVAPLAVSLTKTSRSWPMLPYTPVLWLVTGLVGSRYVGTLWKEKKRGVPTLPRVAWHCSILHAGTVQYAATSSDRKDAVTWHVAQGRALHRKRRITSCTEADGSGRGCRHRTATD